MQRTDAQRGRRDRTRAIVLPPNLSRDCRTSSANRERAISRWIRRAANAALRRRPCLGIPGLRAVLIAQRPAFRLRFSPV